MQTPVDLSSLAREVEMLRNQVLGLTCFVAALPEAGEVDASWVRQRILEVIAQSTPFGGGDLPQAIGIAQLARDLANRGAV